MSTIDDLSGGLVGGNLPVGTLLIISGISYTQTPDGLRRATPEEIAAHAERKASKAAAKAARQQDAPVGPSITIGDIAGGDIIRITIDGRKR